MVKTPFKLMIILTLVFFTSGCALIATGLSAAAGYAIYKATQD